MDRSRSTTPSRNADRPPARSAPSARLRQKIEFVNPAFEAASSRLIDHSRVSELLPEYLVTFHTIIRATVPLMEQGARRAREMAETDAVAAGVASYLETHAEEERDHDEWLLDDLELLGLDRAAVLARVPSPSAASLVGSQYYWLFHYHPVALLGYFAVMEGDPPSAELIEYLVERTGYPREAFRTVAKHGELDPHHRDELDEEIDSLPLTREQETLLGLSAMTTVESLTRAIDEVLESA
ncbi:MAG: iron-containing redox enzyme family protein [Actinomycetota bacterium]|nr:iron-containing redox enzyme family protein [Actinomycetota bacterium]